MSISFSLRLALERRRLRPPPPSWRCRWRGSTLDACWERRTAALPAALKSAGSRYGSGLQSQAVRAVCQDMSRSAWQAVPRPALWCWVLRSDQACLSLPSVAPSQVVSQSEGGLTYEVWRQSLRGEPSNPSSCPLLIGGNLALVWHRCCCCGPVAPAAPPSPRLLVEKPSVPLQVQPSHQPQPCSKLSPALPSCHAAGGLYMCRSLTHGLLLLPPPCSIPQLPHCCHPPPSRRRAVHVPQPCGV